MKLRKLNRLVQGVGVNDADYRLHRRENINGKNVLVWRCPYYNAWCSMLNRCYSVKYHSHLAYKDCSVCDEWLTFSNFKAWMEQQDWQGKQLDKDLLKVDNKVYSPDTCIFVDRTINGFAIGAGRGVGDFMLGVYASQTSNKFISTVCNPFTHKREYLGTFTDELEAHLAWKSRKHELACLLADSEYCTDPRLLEALRKRYAD